MSYMENIQSIAHIVKSEGWSAMRSAVKDFTRCVMEKTLRAELEEYLGCRYNERSEHRLTYANGSYTRSLSTSFGVIERFNVPRPRTGGFQSVLFSQYQRRTTELDASFLSWYLQGESCRDVTRSLQAWSQDVLSAQSVSRVIQSVDRDLALWRHRRLPENLSAVWLDGFSLKVRVKHKVRSYAILMALGRHQNGRWEVLCFQLADEESVRRWSALLEQMRSQGMRSELFVHDGASGIEVSLRRVYPQVKTQRCLVHKIRNILDVLLDQRNRSQIQHDFWFIYEATNEAQAHERYTNFCRRWKRTEPQAVKIAKRAWLSTITYLQVTDETLRSLCRSTNTIELFYRELRRRVKVIGSFPTPQSAERITFMTIRYIEAINLNKSSNMTSLLDQITQN
jgi:putative transposase